MLNRRNFLAASAAIMSNSASSAARFPRGGDTTSEVFLVAGQSNAGDGNALTSADLNAHSVATDPGIKIWTASGWATLQNAVNNDNLTFAGPGSVTWGPEVEFVYQWRLANPTKTLYLIKYAVGGTALGIDSGADFVWMPPPAVVTRSLYTDMNNFCAAALATLPNPKVRALLWMQGESDAGTSALAGNYLTNLTNFCNSIPTHWGQAATKILIGRIANFGGGTWPFASTVQAAQDSVGSSLSSFVRVINTDTFSVQSANHGHYDGPGQVQLGGASVGMYSAYLTF